MRKILLGTLACIFITSSAYGAELNFTNNYNLGVPEYGYTDYHIPVNANFVSIDSLLSMLSDDSSSKACSFVVGSDLTKSDYQNVQEAINALPSRGGKIFILPGDYTSSDSIVISKPVVLEGSGCGVVGAGSTGNTTLLQVTVDGKPCIKVSGDAANLSDVVIKHLKIYGHAYDGNEYTSTSSMGISAGYASNLILEDVFIESFPTLISYDSATLYHTIDKCRFGGARSYAIYSPPGYQASNWKLVNSQFSGRSAGDVGVNIGKGNAIKISGNSFEGYERAIKIGEGNNVSGLSIQGNYFGSQSSADIVILSASGIGIRDNFFTREAATTSNILRLEGTNYTVIEGNNFGDYLSDDIVMTGADYTYFGENSIGDSRGLDCIVNTRPEKTTYFYRSKLSCDTVTADIVTIKSTLTAPIITVISSDVGNSKTPTYITQTSNAQLTNEQALSSLTTGIMYVTNTTGAITSLGTPLPIVNGGTASAVGYTVVSNDISDLKANRVSTDAVLTTLSIGNVSNTEIGYLDGVTSAIQTQLDNRVSPDATGKVGIALASPLVRFQVNGEISGDAFKFAVQTSSPDVTAGCPTLYVDTSDNSLRFYDGSEWYKLN